MIDPKAMKRARISGGLSLARLSRETGVSVSAIQSWESGKITPSVYCVLPVCRLLGVSIEEYIGAAPPETDLLRSFIREYGLEQEYQNYEGRMRGG